jgi:hypothetical protein
MRALFLSRDDAHFDMPETAFFQKLVQLHLAESEPVICIEFTGLFEAVAP